MRATIAERLRLALPRFRRAYPDAREAEARAAEYAWLTFVLQRKIKAAPPLVSVFASCASFTF